MHMFIHLIYTYDIYYAISIRGKQVPYEFEGEWRGVHGRIWRQEREGRL